MNDSGLLSTIVMFAALALMLYFVMIRPARKRSTEHQNMMNALEPGSRIMLTSGMFGTIKYMGEKQAVIELAPGLEVTVLKPAISRVVSEQEEEFEYEDDSDVAADEVSGTSIEFDADRDEFFAAGADEEASSESGADSDLGVDPQANRDADSK